MQNKVIYINDLLDIYGSLLTDKQQSICNLYFKEDCSLAEIAQMESVSRTAIHDILKRSEQLLLHYESNLNVYSSYKQRLELYKQIQDYGNDEINLLVNKCIDTEI